MASEGMILTNHDHQIRVGVLTAFLVDLQVVYCLEEYIQSEVLLYNTKRTIERND